MINARKLIGLYRQVQYFLFQRSWGVINCVSECSIHGNISDYKKDCVHPCVRYTDVPFRGYHWWMVYTPYRNANASQENPILCYGEGNGEPPTEWHVFKEIIPQPKIGYNSDPNLLFIDNVMYLFWRENETERLLDNKMHRGTFCMKITEEDMVKPDEIILAETLSYEDHEVSPTFVNYKNKHIAFANHVLFKSPRLQTIKPVLKQIIDRITFVTDLLGFYSQQKSYGIAVWEGDDYNKPFKYIKSVYPKHCNRLYRPWHSDSFEYKGKLYMIMQSNQCNADVCLARWNDDLSELTMASKPLVTNASIGMVGLYKPTAIVYCDYLYIYITAQKENDRGVNNLYQGKISLSELHSLWD